MEDSREKKLFGKFAAAMEKLLEQSGNSDIIGDLSAGKTSYMRLDRLESSSFDPAWIDTIEDVILDLGDIINNPRINTKSVGDITPVELARKTNAESVQHLASHTQYIKEVDDYGNVIPSKVLNFSNEDELFTYENRFIATFVRKLMLFIEKRYEFVLNFATLHDEEVLYLKNKSFVAGSSVEIETKVKVVSDSPTEMGKLNSAYVERIKEIRRYVFYYYNSPFMKAFRTEKNVRNPILQTNIIRKNVKYHHCYEVYRFIEKYESLGVSYRVDEDYSDFTEEEMHQLHYSLFAAYLSLMGKDKPKPAKETTKVYKPKILTSMDDESFLYGDYLKGPISFVRTDEGYQQFLQRLLARELPTRPKKREKAYYEDEYQDIRDYEEFLKQRDSLLRRKEREVIAFEKKAEEIVKMRELEKKRLAELERIVREQEEEDRLNKIRAQIIQAARELGVAFPPEEPVMETPEPLVPPENDLEEREQEEALVRENKAAVNSEGPDPSTLPMPEPKPLDYVPWSLRHKPEEAKPEEQPVEEAAPQEEATPVADLSAEEQPASEEQPAQEQPAEAAAPEQQPEEAAQEEFPVAELTAEELYEEEELEHQEQEAAQEEATPASELIVEIPPMQRDIVEEEEMLLEEEEFSGEEQQLEEPPLEEEEENIDGLPDLTSVHNRISSSMPPLDEYRGVDGEQVEEPALEEQQEETKPEELQQEEKPEPKPKLVIKKKIRRKRRKIRPRPNVKLRRKDEKLPEEEEPPVEPEEEEIIQEEEPIQEPEIQEEATPVADLEEEAPAEEEEPEPEEIPEGRFVVETLDGYYAGDDRIAYKVKDAYVFDDYKEALSIISKVGGKVVKL